MPRHTQDTGTASDLIAFVTRHFVCMICGTSYHAEDVRVVWRRGSAWQLMASCSRCQAHQAIDAYDAPPYLGLEPPRLPLREAITVDEVRAWAVFLAHFTGNMRDLLGEADVNSSGSG